MEHTRTTLQEFLPHLEAWGRSGLTKNEYCHQNGIKYHRFLYWMRRWKQNSSGDKFYPLNVVSIKSGEVPASTGRFASISLQNRIIIEFHQPVPASYLIELAQSCS